MTHWHAHVPEIRPKERGRSGITMNVLRKAYGLCARGQWAAALKLVNSNARPRTTSDTRRYEASIGAACRAARGRDEIADGWVFVGVVILDLIPKDWRKKDGAPTLRARRAAWQVEPARARPDVDNIVKTLDGADGAWFKGDAKVLSVPWRGWTVDESKAGVHFLLWKAPTPSKQFEIMTTLWPASVKRLAAPPVDWHAP